MRKQSSRRSFLRGLGLLSLGSMVGLDVLTSCKGKSEIMSAQESLEPSLFFKISLAQWSLHRSIFSGKISALDFPTVAKQDFGVDAVEYVNQFFKDKANDKAFLSSLKQRADDAGVKNLLIMCDDEGELGDANTALRKQAVENHYKWVDAAKFLGCHSIRVNAGGSGSAEEVAKNATDGLYQLSSYANEVGINVIVENHGGYSSNGKWLHDVIAATQMDNCGTLPDFGNFCVRHHQNEDGSWGCDEEYDRYQGVEELMPFAKGVSAKTLHFDDQGNCIETDYTRMLQIVKAAKYTGYIGIEFEGASDEREGIQKTKALLERIGATI
jgi:sugar phosphate isomerase/epimerase